MPTSRMPFRIGSNRIGKLIVGSLPEWTPSNLTNTPDFWLDATDYDSLTLSGTDVTTWGDISGNSRDFEAVTTDYASYDATGLNGYPAVEWPNSANTVRYDTATSFAIQEVAFIATFQDGTPTTWGYDFPGLLTGGSDITLIGHTSSGNKFYSGCTMYSGSRDGTLGQFRNTDAALPIDATIFVLHRPGGSISRNWQIGNDRGNSNRGWRGPMGEWIATNTRWTTDERQRIEGYLAWKWGVEGNLPSDHPYKSASPKVE